MSLFAAQIQIRVYGVYMKIEKANMVLPTGTLVLVNETDNGAHPDVTSAEKDTTGNGLIVMSCVSVSPQLPAMVYVIVVVPAPATLGSNAPVIGLVIPFPLQVPPGLAAVNVIGFASIH